MTSIPDKNLRRKLHGAYHRAEADLIAEREKHFPPGTIVRCPLLGMTFAVTGGSLYADQVNTTSGHMGWSRLEIVG